MKRWGAFANLAVVALLGSPACTTEAYCFDCKAGSPMEADAGTSGSGGIFGQLPDAAVGSGGLFNPNTNCSADLDTDPLNCGVCNNVCEQANAFPVCVDGFCQIGSCGPGFVDNDGIVANGCEYACTVSAEVEVCDGLDNDCNGAIDEDFDLNVDPLNCGACGVVCSLPNSELVCIDGECTFVECTVGFVDIDGDVETGGLAGNGCEYQCSRTNNGVEVCDGVDNDCDTEIDEGIDITSDPENCGGCGNGCIALFPNSETSCIDSSCGFVDCLPGYIDLDGVIENGCEYSCTPTSGGEVCDGIDNDCNGVADDGVLPGVGDTCGATEIGECTLGVQRCVAGRLICEGSIEPAAELCDSLDNDCTGIADENCPSANRSVTRIDQGSRNSAPSSQLHAANLGADVYVVYTQHDGEDANIRFNASVDSGSTWLASAFGVETSGNDEVEPWVFASETKIYVAYERFQNNVRRIYLRDANAPFSNAGGFSERRRVDTASGASRDLFFVRGAVAKADPAGDWLVLVWQQIDISNGQRDVFLQASRDGGQSWLASNLRVNATAGQAEFPALATDGTGNAYVSFRDRRNAEALADIYDVERGSLSGNVSVSAGNPTTDVSVAADALGNVHVAWTDLRSERKTIRVNSRRAGASFRNDGLIVNRDSTFADADNPSLAAARGRVAVAWEDTRSGLSDIYANRAGGAFTNWSTTTARVDRGSAAGTFAATQPAIAYGSGNLIFVVWEDTRSGAKDIYGNHSFDRGVTFQPIDIRLDLGSRAGSADSQTPFAFAPAPGDRGLAVWLDSTNGSNGFAANADVYSNFFE